MNHRVLLVDDDESMRSSVKRVLEMAGYEVATAVDSDDAVKRFSAANVDLLILDLNDLSCAAFEDLTQRWRQVPSIIMTGLPNQCRTAANAGAGALLEKPIDARALLETAEELIAKPESIRLSACAG